ncbi:MAG: hypothetical protein ACRD5B_17735, partial [Nitrososphaeraceae archaeon]
VSVVPLAKSVVGYQRLLRSLLTPEMQRMSRPMKIYNNRVASKDIYIIIAFFQTSILDKLAKRREICM